MGDDSTLRGRWDRWLYLASGVLLAGVAVAVVVLPSGGPDSARASFTPDMVSVLSESVSDRYPWLIEMPDLDKSGYVGLVGGPDAGSVILLWHGPADAVQGRILERVRADGTAIRVEQRRHGRVQLDRAAQAMVGSSEKGAFAGFQILMIEPVSARFDGVVVSGELAPEQKGAPAEVEAALSSAATAEFGVAVDVEISMLVAADG